MKNINIYCIMKNHEKENVLFENQEIIVLKDVKDYQDFDYSYFENCEIEKSLFIIKLHML